MWGCVCTQWPSSHIQALDRVDQQMHYGHHNNNNNNNKHYVQWLTVLTGRCCKGILQASLVLSEGVTLVFVHTCGPALIVRWPLPRRRAREEEEEVGPRAHHQPTALLVHAAAPRRWVVGGRDGTSSPGGSAAGELCCVDSCGTTGTAEQQNC